MPPASPAPPPPNVCPILSRPRHAPRTNSGTRRSLRLPRWCTLTPRPRPKRSVQLRTPQPQEVCPIFLSAPHQTQPSKANRLSTNLHPHSHIRSVPLTRSRHSFPPRHPQTFFPQKRNGTRFPRCRPQNLSRTVDQREYNSTINCSFTIGSISSRLGSRFTVPDSLSRSWESQSGTTIACVMSKERSPIC